MGLVKVGVKLGFCFVYMVNYFWMKHNTWSFCCANLTCLISCAARRFIFMPSGVQGLSDGSEERETKWDEPSGRNQDSKDMLWNYKLQTLFPRNNAPLPQIFGWTIGHFCGMLSFLAFSSTNINSWHLVRYFEGITDIKKIPLIVLERNKVCQCLNKTLNIFFSPEEISRKYKNTVRIKRCRVISCFCCFVLWVGTEQNFSMCAN